MIHIVYTVFQYIFLLTSNYSVTQKFTGMVFTGLYTTALGLRFSWDHSTISAPVEMMNALITLEEDLMKGD